MKTADFIERIIAYENGELNTEETVKLFQYLIDTGMTAHLQGHYGRTAQKLILVGDCRPQSSPFSLN